MSETEFVEDVEAICKRPNMYTPTGTFYEAVSFLEGYGKGHNVGNKTYHCIFTPFLKWIVKKLNIQDADYGTIIDWQRFQALFSSEEEAFKQLPILEHLF